MLFLASLFPLIQVATALSLTVGSSGGNASSQLLYGLLYEVSLQRVKLSEVQC